MEKEKENLREFYITPLYLETMRRRARTWSESFLEIQVLSFQKTIPEYPEVQTLLETELHTRRLNRLHSEIHGAPADRLKELLVQFKEEADYCEIIQTELEILNGVKKLKENNAQSSSEKTNARII